MKRVSIALCLLFAACGGREPLPEEEAIPVEEECPEVKPLPENFRITSQFVACYPTNDGIVQTAAGITAECVCCGGCDCEWSVIDEE